MRQAVVTGLLLMLLLFVPPLLFAGPGETGGTESAPPSSAPEETAPSSPLLDSGTVAILRQPGPAALSELADGPVPFRLIPYHTVSSGCELMAAFTPDGVWVDGKPVKAVVAVAPRSVSDGGAYSALLSV